jgi:hypothetical protein
MVWLSTLLRRVLRRFLQTLPEGSREFGVGLLAETDELPQGAQQVGWLLGGVRFVASERRLTRTVLYGAALTAAVAGLVEANATVNADVGGPACMALLLLESAALGCAAPRRAWLSGTVVGGALGVTGLLTVAAGRSLPASMHPAGAAGAASLLVLIIPALIAAHTAAALRRRVG